MRYEMKMTAYDMFEDVLVGVRVWETTDPMSRSSTPVLELTAAVRGRGESDPSKWLRATLVALLEEERERRLSGAEAPSPMGVPHTISGIGDNV